MNIKTFIEETEKLGIKLSKYQLECLEKYYNLLLEWNSKINLTRITKKEEVYLKHFYDSLTLVKIIDLSKNYKLCDVGTGAGFPGIVLKIVFPELDIVLIDSLNKRIIFLNEVIEKLNLKKIETIHMRMEEYSRKNIERFDIITSRAVARTEILTEISIQGLKLGGHLVLMKAQCEKEIESSKGIINELKSKINKIERFNLPVEDSVRTLIDIQKLEKTPSKYPRSIDKIKNHCKKMKCIV